MNHLISRKNIYLRLFFILGLINIYSSVYGQICPGSIWSDDYSNPGNWASAGTTSIAPSDCGIGTATGSLEVSGNQLNFYQYRPRQTFRLLRSLNGAISNQNQFRFEFDFIINPPFGEPVGGIIFAVTSQTDHPYTNVSGSTTETNNNTLEVRLANPLNSGTDYMISATSKFGTTRGASSPTIGITAGLHYWIRIERINGQQVVLSVYNNSSWTSLVASVCMNINSGIGNLNYVQHGGAPSAGCSRVLRGTLDNLCLYNSLISDPCSVCGNQTNISVNSGTICFGQSYTINPTGASTYTISGGSFIVSPSNTTTYSVTGTDVNGCENTVTVNLTVNECVGLSKREKTESLVRIFPNPNTGQFVLELSKHSQVIIYNTLGQTIYNETLNSGKSNLDIRDVAAGVYLIQAGEVQFKMIKE